MPEEAGLPSAAELELPNPTNMNMQVMADGQHRDTGRTTGSLSAASSQPSNSPSASALTSSGDPSPLAPSELTLVPGEPFPIHLHIPLARGTVQISTRFASAHDEDDSDPSSALDSTPKDNLHAAADHHEASSTSTTGKGKMEGLSMQDLKGAGAASSSSHSGAGTSQMEEAKVENRNREEVGVDEGMEEDADVGSTTLAERTLVNDPITTTTASRTRVHTHVKGPSSSSLSLPVGEDGAGAGEGPSRTYAYQPMHAPHKSVDKADGQSQSQSQRQSEEQPRTATTAVTWDPLKGTGTDDDRHEHAEKTHRRRGTQDDTVVVEDDGEDVVDSKGKLLFPDEEEEKGGGGVGGITPASAIARRASHLRLDLKPAPASPLPWEQIEPPPDNNSKSIAGYYSPVASQKFRTSQGSG